MDEQQLQQQIVQLVQAAMQGDKQATQQIQQIMQAAQQGDQQAAQLAQMIQDVAQQMQQQQVQAAKFGAKLNYIQHLKGVCPEGYEMQLFKQGGQICRKCIKKAMMEDEGKTSQNSVDAFKCGRKMKKKACGGTMTKVKKHLFGGKQRRPFTGFEGLSYQYEAANPSIQSRASRPADEWITNNGKMIMGRETWYDPESNQQEDVGYYYPGYSAERDWEAPNEQTQQTRTFNSLKRHALMNQRLREPKFACGGPVKKDQKGGTVKAVRTVTTYPNKLENQQRTVQYFDDGTQAVFNGGWGTDGRFRATLRGRRGEFGNSAGTPRQQQIADSLRRVDWKQLGWGPIQVPALKKTSRKK